MISSLLKRIHAVALESVIERAEDYVRRDRVHIKRRNRDEVRAEVRGTKVYRVWCAADVQGGTAWECDCPYDGPGPCKHVLAAVLTVEDEAAQKPPTAALQALRAASQSDLAAFLAPLLSESPELEYRFLTFLQARSGKVDLKGCANNSTPAFAPPPMTDSCAMEHGSTTPVSKKRRAHARTPAISGTRPTSTIFCGM